MRRTLSASRVLSPVERRIDGDHMQGLAIHRGRGRQDVGQPGWQVAAFFNTHDGYLQIRQDQGRIGHISRRSSAWGRRRGGSGGLEMVEGATPLERLRRRWGLPVEGKRVRRLAVGCRPACELA
jgi:hypothetical protein